MFISESLHCLGVFKCLIMTTNERVGRLCEMMILIVRQTQPFIVKDIC